MSQCRGLRTTNTTRSGSHSNTTGLDTCGRNAGDFRTVMSTFESGVSAASLHLGRPGEHETSFNWTGAECSLHHSDQALRKQRLQGLEQGRLLRLNRGAVKAVTVDTTTAAIIVAMVGLDLSDAKVAVIHHAIKKRMHVFKKPLSSHSEPRATHSHSRATPSHTKPLSRHFEPPKSHVRFSKFQVRG